jgi:hypothetical protein
VERLITSMPMKATRRSAALPRRHIPQAAKRISA